MGPYINRVRLIPAMITLSFALSASGCTAAPPEETLLFERAEMSYTLGDYDGAIAMYQLFLRDHALSPLAPIAEQRIGTIERELDAIMGRRGAPAPVYASPYATGAALRTGTTETFQPVRAPSLPTFER